MQRLATFVLGIALACCTSASALNPSLDISQYAHTAWTIRDGFFKGSIISVAQTPDGYLWLGTEYGLLRFDGVRAVPWQPPTDEHLPGSNIRRLLAGRDGRLWIGTNQGLASWKDGKLTHYPALDSQDILALREDREGTVWVGGWSTSTGRLCEIRRGSTQCYGEDGGFGSGVVSLYEDSRGDLWAGAATGLWRWKPGPPKLYPLPEAQSEINAMIEGDNGTLLLAMHGGLKQLVDGKVQAYSFPGVVQQFRPVSLLRDRDGGLWIGTLDRGLLHVYRGRTDFFAQPDGLSGNFALGLFEDREGSIWIADVDGLDRFRDFAVPTFSVRQGLSSSAVQSVLAARDGSVWLGTVDGLNRWNDGRITIYRKQNSALPDDSADSLFEDDRGRIWVSTIHGVAYFEDGRFIPAPAVPGGFVHSFAADGQGNIWIDNQEQGLLHIVQGRVAERVPWADLNPKDIAYSLLPDSSPGSLWLGFGKGGVANVKAGKIGASYSAADGLGGGMVSDLKLDGDGTLWAATQGGLSRVRNGRVATLTMKNGLPCDAVTWVMEDDDHSVWLGTACGLVRIPRAELNAWSADPKRTIRVAVFDSSDGVRSHPTSSAYSPHVAKTRDGKLWFLPFDGISVIDPHHLPFNKLPPPVNIEQITADRKTYDANSNLRLPPLVRDLEIDYTALSLVAPEKNRFRVKLEGRDPDWKDVGNERKTFYNDLPPRNYRFRVMASNNSGVWNQAGAAFDFSIAPAYYQTAWFQALCLAAFLALLWGLYRYRLHQIARQFNMQLEARVGERTRIARDLHDTLLQSFQGLMLRLQVVANLLTQGKVERAQEELELSLDRADQAIAEGRDAVRDLRLSATTTNELAQAVTALGNELAAEGTAAFRLVVEGATLHLHPVIRDEVYRIVREALRNAFSHAKAQHIEAEISYGERVFRVRIRDDGAGIPTTILEEGRHGHYGLPGMRERAGQIGAKLNIWSGDGAGTEVELSIAGSIAYGKSAGVSGS
jgi:signal transduction histidine kinase